MHKRSAIDSSSPTTAPTVQQNSSNNNLNNSSSSNLSNISLQQQKLLGVNGTGQRKDLSSLTTPSPVLAATITTTPLKKYDDNQPYISDDGFTLNIEESDVDEQEEAKKNNLTKFKDVCTIKF